MNQSLKRSDRLAILRIVAIYAGVAAMWIYFSDSALGFLEGNPEVMVRLSIFKGFFFILVTSALLYQLIARHLRRSRQMAVDLQISRCLVGALMEGTTDTVYLKDRMGRYLLFNTAAEKVTGKSAEEVMGRDDTFLFPPREAETIMAGDRRVMETGLVMTYEESLSASDGSTRTFLATKGPVHDVWGEVSGLFGIARDITQRKQGEEALLASERRYRSLFENMLDGFAYCRMLFDDRGRPVDFVYLDINRAFERLTGLRDVKGRKVSQVIPGIREAHPELFDIYGRVAMTGRPEVFDIDFTPLGIWLSLSVFSTERNTFVVVFDNITERKRAEAALLESENMLQRAEALAHLGHWRHDLDANLVSWSEEMYRIHGTSPEAYRPSQDNYPELVHPENRSVLAKTDEALRLEGATDFEYRIIRPDGEVRHVTGYGEIQRDEAGKAVAVFGTLMDTTEIKRKERELEEKNTELERFTYMISHDLKSPLITVKTFLGYLEQDLVSGDTGKIAQDVRYIRSAADRMARLLDELLEMSRIGRIANQPEDVTFRDLVAEALDLVSGSIAEQGTAVEVADAAITLAGDRPRLVEIWQNLVENAVKFMGDQTSPLIEIGVDPGENGGIFFVRDNGIGIEPRFHDKIFGLFEKLNSRTDGTGLGLALVRRIVELYQGSIWVESEGPGRGSCFRFTLPGAIRGNEKGETS